MNKYAKAIIAFVALVAALLNANGFEIPDETIDQISSTIILIIGTFAVYQVPNKKE